MDGDYLVPDPQVEREFGVTSMTIWRWTRDPELGFPPAIQIKNRNYRSRQQLEAFKSRLLAEAIGSQFNDPHSTVMREAYEARRMRRMARRAARKQTA